MWAKFESSIKFLLCACVCARELVWAALSLRPVEVWCVSTGEKFRLAVQRRHEYNHAQAPFAVTKPKATLNKHFCIQFFYF